MLFRWLTSLALCIFSVLGTLSSSFAEMSYELIVSNDGERILIIGGKFDFDDDLAGFTAAVHQHKPNVISFDSSGGNPFAAMNYGRRIRALGLDTVQVRKLDCMSACALAFLGGVNRSAEPGSIGVHQSSFASTTDLSGADAVAAIQSLTAQIVGYMAEMGVSADLLQVSLAVGSDDIRFLTGQEMASFGVTRTGVQASIASKPIADPIPSRVPVSQPKPNPPHSQKPLSNVAAAHDFIFAYHDAWSQSNDRALNFMTQAYESLVSFYGKSVPVNEVLSDKRKFATRWPERLYEIKQDTLSIECDQLCAINAVVVWYTSSKPRNATSSGEATFALIWNPLTGRISAESGKVVSIDRKSGSPTHLIKLWRSENEYCRGGSYNDATAPGGPCDRRERISQKLATVNWCYGREGEFGYQHSWHRCGPRSYR